MVGTGGGGGRQVGGGGGRGCRFNEPPSETCACLSGWR